MLANTLRWKAVKCVKARILSKVEKTDIVLEAENETEEKRLDDIWEARENITLVSICRIGEPSRPGIYLSLKTKSGGN